jgi:hypothetical protein
VRIIGLAAHHGLASEARSTGGDLLALFSLT